VEDLIGAAKVGRWLTQGTQLTTSGGAGLVVRQPYRC
jgi:hypothetical protein